MSVPAGLRKRNKLTVIVKARQLSKYTIQICTNENTFSPQFKDVFTKDLINYSKEIYFLCYSANGIKANYEGLVKRVELQTQAMDLCTRFMAMIELAQEVFHLSTKRTEYWLDMVWEVRVMIHGWQAGDKNGIKSVCTKLK